MTTLYLAYSIASPAVRSFREHNWEESQLGMLVSFAYIKDFRRQFTGVLPKSKGIPPTLLDSGAFSAFNSGKTIDINALISETLNMGWDEVVALDVIKDHEASMKNAVYMKERGCTVMPVFHIGEPFEVLTEYCKLFERVGLSCRFGEPESASYLWLDKCFRQSYPKKFHSFGWMGEKVLMRYPFYTADSSSWALAPQAYKRWKTYGGRLFIKESKDVSLLPEMEFYSNLQKRVRHKWSKEMVKLNGQLESVR